jgi:serine/threonine protein kinase
MNTKNYLTILQEMQDFEISIISNTLDTLDKNASDLIIKMLHKNPASRITLKEILKHPFIS